MTEIDVPKEIRRAIDTGKAVLGERESEKYLLNGIGELIIVAKNARQGTLEKTLHLAHLAGIPVLDFEGTGMELGAVCGKPYRVTVMVIENHGKSSIQKAVETRTITQKPVKKKTRKR